MFVNGMFLILRQLSGLITGLLTIVVLSRYYGPKIQGEYTSIILIPTLIITFINLGMATSISFFLSSKRANLKIIKTIIYKTIIYLTIISGLIAFVFIYFSRNNYYENIHLFYILLSLILIPLLLYNNVMGGIFQGLERFKIYGIIISFGQFSGLIFTLIFIFVMPKTLFAPLIAYIISQIVISIYISLQVKLIYNEETLEKEIINPVNFKEFINYGIKTHLTNVLAFLLYRIDILLITFFLSSKEVAFYSTGVSIVEKLWLVSQSFSTVLFPRLSSINENRRRLTELISRNIFWITIIICIILFPNINFVVSLLFGKEYISSAHIIKILLFGMVFGSIPRIVATYFSANGHPEYNMYTSLILVIINTILNLILIPYYGIKGAAIATSIAYIVNLITKLFIYKKFFDGSLKGLLILNKNDFILYKKVLSGVRLKLSK